MNLIFSEEINTMLDSIIERYEAETGCESTYEYMISGLVRDAHRRIFDGDK